MRFSVMSFMHSLTVCAGPTWMTGALMIVPTVVSVDLRPISTTLRA